MSDKWYWIWKRSWKEALVRVVPFAKHHGPPRKRSPFFTFRLKGSVALVNQTNCSKNFSRFSKNGKKVIARKVFLSFRKISTGMNCSISILPGITGISIQMVSAPYNLAVNFKQSKEWQKNWIPRFSVSNHLKICQNLLLTGELWKKKNRISFYTNSSDSFHSLKLIYIQCDLQEETQCAILRSQSHFTPESLRYGQNAA